MRTTRPRMEPVYRIMVHVPEQGKDYPHLVCFKHAVLRVVAGEEVEAGMFYPARSCWDCDGGEAGRMGGVPVTRVEIDRISKDGP